MSKLLYPKGWKQMDKTGPGKNYTPRASADPCETLCYDCETPIHEGDMVTHDHVSGLIFCKSCSPTFADMLAEHESYSCGTDEHGDPIYLTAEAARKLADEHIAKGGALTDKFGLSRY